MPKRPPKSWWRSCVDGVETHEGAIDPKRVCGAVWSRKSVGEKRLLTKLAERHKQKLRGGHAKTSGASAFDASVKARRLRKLAAKLGG